MGDRGTYIPCAGRVVSGHPSGKTDAAAGAQGRRLRGSWRAMLGAVPGPPLRRLRDSPCGARRRAAVRDRLDVAAAMLQARRSSAAFPGSVAPGRRGASTAAASVPVPPASLLALSVCSRGVPGATPARLLPLLLLLGLPVLCSAGLWELGPTIDGQRLAVCTLREGESSAFTCRAPRPVPGAALEWYLDGRRQTANCLATGTASTLTLTAWRTDRELNCSLTDLASGATYNASVLLDVQYKPEILQADAHYQEVEGAGLLLVLFVLVQANPTASVTWVDQDGHMMGNASEFVLLGTAHYPELANYSLRIYLGRTAGNFSVRATNSVGIATASLLPPGLLDTHVELPLLGIAVGAAVALGALLSLGSCAACLACCWAKLVPGKGEAEGSNQLSHCSHCGGSDLLLPSGSRLPCQTQSLPPNLRLSDFTEELRASPKDMGAGARGEESTILGSQNPLVLSELGFIQLPVSGRIYKVPSTSSDEIWL